METKLIQRQSSIENEPRTLNLNQIDFAREAALHVVKTRSTEEALRVFTEGLVPVMRTCGDACISSRQEDEFCDRIRTADRRDVASAPF